MCSPYWCLYWCLCPVFDVVFHSSVFFWSFIISLSSAELHISCLFQHDLLSIHDVESKVVDKIETFTWATTWHAPSEDSDQPGHPPILIRVFAVRMKKPWVLSYPLSAQRRLWSDWADAQVDLSLRWAHSHFVVLSCRGSHREILCCTALTCVDKRKHKTDTQSKNVAFIYSAFYYLFSYFPFISVYCKWH